MSPPPASAPPQDKGICVPHSQATAQTLGVGCQAAGCPLLLQKGTCLGLCTPAALGQPSWVYHCAWVGRADGTGGVAVAGVSRDWQQQVGSGWSPCAAPAERCLRSEGATAEATGASRHRTCLLVQSQRLPLSEVSFSASLRGRGGLGHAHSMLRSPPSPAAGVPRSALIASTGEEGGGPHTRGSQVKVPSLGCERVC